MSAPAGWHRQGDGRERYWDGQQWTNQFRGGPTGPDMPGATWPSPAPQPKTGGNTKHWIGYGATGLVALLIGSAIGASAAGGAPAAAPTTTTTLPASTVTTTVTPPAATTITKVATVRVTPTPKAAIQEGVWEVGVDIAPGTYKVIEPVAGDCYWEINPTGKSDIVDNGVVTGGRPVVILRKGQTFTNRGCGDWARVR